MDHDHGVSPGCSIPLIRPKKCFTQRWLLLPVIGLLCAVALAQTSTSGDYTAALPSVEKVKAQIKGTDPTDTTARQVAVFTYLQTYITRIRDARKYNGPFTSGEEKLMKDYAVAGYQLSQDFTKSHSPEEVKAFQQLEGKIRDHECSRLDQAALGAASSRHLSWHRELSRTELQATRRSTSAADEAGQMTGHITGFG